MIGNPLAWSSCMIRAEATRRFEPFADLDRRHAEDFDLYHRLSRVGEIARLDEELLLYRLHGDNASIRYETTMTANAARVLAEAYRAELGAEAEGAVALVATHLMARRLVPDRRCWRNSARCSSGSSARTSPRTRCRAATTS